MAEPIPVNSSWVESIDFSAGLLTVNTKKGKPIVFLGVPPEIWEQLQAAPSKGEFINKFIKGKFKEL
jgi:UDP-N-acetyl-D-mannosaminuronic acid transferase (WecB/TagA/CpsF family)